MKNHKHSKGGSLITFSDPSSVVRGFSHSYIANIMYLRILYIYYINKDIELSFNLGFI